MLALLDDVPGVAVSRVDWTGRQFLLELDRGASPATVTPHADKLLGGETTRLDRDAESRAVRSYREGGKWLRAGETVAMSRAEAGILASRHGAEAAEHAGLDAAQRTQLIAILEEEIAAAFARILESEEGLSARMQPEFERVFEATVAKCRAFLNEAQIARMQELFDSLGE